VNLYSCGTRAPEVTCGHLWSPMGTCGETLAGVAILHRTPSVRMIPIFDPGYSWSPGHPCSPLSSLAYLPLPQVRKVPKPLGTTEVLPCPLATLDRPWTGWAPLAPIGSRPGPPAGGTAGPRPIRNPLKFLPPNFPPSPHIPLNFL
jgi:hypothetical protein